MEATDLNIIIINVKNFNFTYVLTIYIYLYNDRENLKNCNFYIFIINILKNYTDDNIKLIAHLRHQIRNAITISPTSNINILFLSNIFFL